LVKAKRGDISRINVYGQEKEPATYRLAKMNLALRGISHNLGSESDSSFTHDLHKGLYFDYIMANPPFNLDKWRGTDELTDDPRFIRAGFSVMPPVANVNYAWILHILSKLDRSHGVAGFLLANGALNADDVEYTLRKEILLRDVVEAIIVLPRDMFYTTDISVTLWLLNMNKKAGVVNGRKLRDRTDEILFMDLRRWDSNIEEIVIDKGKKKKKTVLVDEQIARVKKIFNAWQSGNDYSDVPELCRAATLDEISEKDFSLAPSKYIEFVDHDLEIDYPEEMTRIQNEMRELLTLEKNSQVVFTNAFRGIDYDIN
ncbi:MAG: N-6 DNA methylase, partial [Clostridia bacterium]|nr:N-6 DNA methylase [Clostridia bacterium]